MIIYDYKMDRMAWELMEMIEVTLAWNLDFFACEITS